MTWSWQKKLNQSANLFFLIRTKIDEVCRLKSGERAINEADILEEIRQDCIKNVKQLISSEEEIFLISNYDTNEWDFDRLIEAIGEVLPLLQRECFTLSLTNVTRKCLKRKAKFLKGKLK